MLFDKLSCLVYISYDNIQPAHQFKKEYRLDRRNHVFICVSRKLVFKIKTLSHSFSVL